MQTKDVLRFIFVCSCIGVLSSCGASGESEIAQNITMRVTSNAIVLPTDIPESPLNTCNKSGVSGPRIRLRGAISWPTSMANKYGNLVPLVVSLVINNPRVEPDESTITLSSGDENTESVAFLFGIDPTLTDYVPADGAIYTSGESTPCYFDFGGVPVPTNELKGGAQLVLKATVRISGVTRIEATGVETPFIKEVKTNLVYSAGSVPEN